MKRAIAMSLLLLCNAAAVHAQREPQEESQTGSRFKQKARQPDPDKGRVMQKDVARCLAYSDKTEARRLLANSDSENIYFEALGYDGDTLFDRLNFENCLSRAMSASTYKIEMRLSFQLLRGLLAEEMYLIDNKAAPTIAADAPVYLEAREAGRDLHPRAVAKAKIADCIVHAAVADADALIRSRPGSREEQAAITALKPVVATCAGPGTNVDSIDKTVLRLFVADGLWARAHYGTGAASDDSAPRPPAAGGV